MGGISVHRQQGEGDKDFFKRFQEKVMSHLTSDEKRRLGFWQDSRRRKGGVRKNIAAKKG